MRAMLPALFVAATLAQGCIIYETEGYGDRDCINCTDLGDTDPTKVNTGDPSETTDPVTDPDPEPIEVDLYLTIDSGEQGDTIITTMESGDSFDLSLIVDITFVGDIEILDRVDREDEIILLLDIAEDAEVGEAACFVELTDGTAALLPVGFDILEAAPTCTGTGGGTGTGGAGGTDTGVPCP